MLTTAPHVSDAAELAWPVLSCRHTRVDAGGACRQGWLVLADGNVIAALVRLDAAQNGEHDCSGAWHLEAGFGPCASARADPFPTIADALDWVRERLLHGAAQDCRQSDRREGVALAVRQSD
jgi:hypothetical protein